MSFENDVKKWAEKANLKMEDVIKSAIFEIGQSVIMRTPVDKGRAVNSWMFSIDIPSTSTRGEGLSGAASFANLQGVKESAPGHIMYCTNNVKSKQKIVVTDRQMYLTNVLKLSFGTRENCGPMKTPFDPKLGQNYF